MRISLSHSGTAWCLERVERAALPLRGAADGGPDGSTPARPATRRSPRCGLRALHRGGATAGSPPRRPAHRRARASRPADRLLGIEQTPFVCTGGCAGFLCSAARLLSWPVSRTLDDVTCVAGRRATAVPCSHDARRNPPVHAIAHSCHARIRQGKGELQVWGWRSGGAEGTEREGTEGTETISHRAHRATEIHGASDALPPVAGASRGGSSTRTRSTRRPRAGINRRHSIRDSVNLRPPRAL